MIRANLSSGGLALNTGEFITTQSGMYSGTVSNNAWSTPNAYIGIILGVDGYSSMTCNSNAVDVIGFNDISDATHLTVTANTAIDISGYKYLEMRTSNAINYTFA